MRHIGRILLNGFLNRRGNVAMLTGLLLFPMIAMTGLAIDFASQRRGVALLQDSLDAALLSAARSKMPDGPARDAHVLGMVKANLEGRIDPDTVATTVDNGAEPGQVVGTATGVVPLRFGGLFGTTGGVLNVRAEVSAASGELEVVLALDTTASMTGTRIDALKVAAENMIDTLMEEDGTKIGIVPFAQYVNVGMSNRNEPGLDIPANGRTCWMDTEHRPENQRNCRRITQMCENQTCREVPATCYNDGVPYACTRNECTNNGTFRDCSYDTCDYDWVPYPVERCADVQWYGCVGSRNPPFNTQDDRDDIGVPGVMNVGCENPLQRLTDNAGQLRSTVRNLRVGSETYIPAGLSMGWAVLSHRYPFNDGTPSTPGAPPVSRAIVLMTDGANTLSKNGDSPRHEWRDVATANAVVRELCRNVKAEGVMIATVAFEVTDPTITALLRSCASNPSMAYTPDSAAELNTAFDAIAGQLQALRVSR